MAEHLLVMCEGPDFIPMGVGCLGDSSKDLNDNRKLPLLTSAKNT